jgi:hypothetical protein
VSKPIIRAAPTRSSCRIVSFQVASTGCAALFGSKKKKVTTAATKPMGRLIQKHCDTVSMAIVGIEIPKND